MGLGIIFNLIDKLPDKRTKINSIPSTLAMMIFCLPTVTLRTQLGLRGLRIYRGLFYGREHLRVGDEIFL